MRAIRRVLQVVTLVGTLMVGVLALALIVSQTPWFRDWLRRYIVRESKQYLNGELTIGRLGGNLLFGVDLADVAVDVSGERVVAVKGVELDYSVFSLISKGIVARSDQDRSAGAAGRARRQRLESGAAGQASRSRKRTARGRCARCRCRRSRLPTRASSIDDSTGAGRVAPAPASMTSM